MFTVEMGDCVEGNSIEQIQEEIRFYKKTLLECQEKIERREKEIKRIKNKLIRLWYLEEGDKFIWFDKREDREEHKHECILLEKKDNDWRTEIRFFEEKGMRTLYKVQEDEEYTYYLDKDQYVIKIS